METKEQAIPMTEKCPPPPYSSPENASAGTVGLERPAGATVSPPPPYPVSGPAPVLAQASVPTAVPYPTPAPVQPIPQPAPVPMPAPYPPIQQQPKPQMMMGPYPTAAHVGQGPAMYPVAPAYTAMPPVQMCQPGATTVIVNAPPPTIIKVGPKSVFLQCPNCREPVYTKVKKEPSDKAMILCMVLCLLGCDAGCCLIPLWVDDLQDVDHKCPRCKYMIGQYKA